MNPFDAASPFDARYYFADPEFFARLHPYVSEDAQVGYLARIEAALAETLADAGVCPRAAATEIGRAAAAVTPEEVYAEEAPHPAQHPRPGQLHPPAASAPPRSRTSIYSRPRLTSWTPPAPVPGRGDTRRAAARPGRADAPADRAGPAHADTPQMGRTHGQHAVPLTFGFAVALYVSRIGQRIEVIARAARNLRGKFAGAVGAYNALALLTDEPATIEAALMRKLGLEPPEISTQVTQPEYVADYVYALTACWGVFANLADDFRHLQRSEIRELRDRKAADPNTAVVGSSTMPHKVNPKDFENVKSLWKAYVPRLLTVLMDQISEHQRDLTNSASMRFVTEFVAAFAYAIHRLSSSLDCGRARRGPHARSAGERQGPGHRRAAVRAAGAARPSRCARGGAGAGAGCAGAASAAGAARARECRRRAVSSEDDAGTAGDPGRPGEIPRRRGPANAGDLR